MSRTYDGWLKVAHDKYQHDRFGEVVRERTRVWRARPRGGTSSGGWGSMRQAQLVCERECR